MVSGNAIKVLSKKTAIAGAILPCITSITLLTSNIVVYAMLSTVVQHPIISWMKWINHAITVFQTVFVIRGGATRAPTVLLPNQSTSCAAASIISPRPT